MNIHHLELFYYVAKFEGITSAVRKMPYGIQQPAVSGQILQLERELSVKLFNRRPFALTPAGEELYDFLYPFFSRLDDVEAKLKGEESRHLRIAASASVLRNHMPDLLVEMRVEEPDLRFTLREVEPADIHGLLMNQKVDIAISIIYGRLTEGLQAVELIKLPLVLLVPVEWKVCKLSDILIDDPYSRGKIAKYPLIGLPPQQILGKMFLDALDERDINWTPSMEVDSLDLIGEYAVRGFGAGLGVGIPGKELQAGLREIRLQGFPPLVVGAIHHGPLKPIAKEFLNKAKKRVRSLTKRS
ncbi:MAG: LysR family transcriptional regulator [Akkermansiaceae bacterium]